MRPLQRVLTLLLLTFVFWGCEQSNRRTQSAIDYIPANAHSVIKLASFETTRNDLASTHLYEQLNNSALYEFFKTSDPFFSQLSTSGESILCFRQTTDSTQDIVFVAPLGSITPPADSLASTGSEKNNYNGYSIETLTPGSVMKYRAQVDSMYIATSSKQVLQDIIDNKTENDPQFRKAFGIKSKDGLVNITSPNQLAINDSVTVSLGARASLELQILPEGVEARGVLLDGDSTDHLVSVFKGLQPQPHQAERVIPLEAMTARGFTYDDVDMLTENLRAYRNDSLVLPAFFESTNEITSIQLPEGTAIVVTSIDPEIAVDEFKRYTEEGERFREVQLYAMAGEGLSFEVFHPLVDRLEATLAFQLDQFFVFTESQEVAQSVIGAYKNNATLANTSYFEGAATQMSQSSSMVVYDMQGRLSNWITSFLEADASQVNKFPLAVLQLSYDRDFAHINLVCKEVAPTQQSTGLVTQLFTKTLDAPLLSAPQFFTNHRTRGKDIVVQDIENQLYLLSAGGKVLWKKRLDGAILGSIQEVDLLRNGKKQLAFVTASTLYIIDRNGNSVAPFPKKYQDKITQPLSIFDYDNRRNYRFVVTQGNKVFMYDSKGKIVTGFTFKQTQSRIVLPPQHIRMGNKDYLLFAEENGKLNILSRVGKERVKVDKKFSFSEMPVAREGLSFVVIDENNDKHSISQTGQVSSQSLNVADNYWFEILGSTKITLDDNLLRINGKLIELPFGVYTNPHLVVANRKTYVLITDLQEKKVYVLDKEGNHLKGFPIYGSSTAALGDAKNNRKNAVVVQGNDNEVILYTVD
ncbi:MAG: hypothetical protein AAF466_13335 [Bacteroidota bacterium]